jgi:hypothetical protein
MNTADNIQGIIKFRSGGVLYTLNYVRYYLSENIEKIKVYGKEKEIHLQSNRPELSRKKNKRAAQWKIISGITPELYNNSPFVAQLLYVIETVLEEIDNPKSGKTYQEYLRDKKSW